MKKNMKKKTKQQDWIKWKDWKLFLKERKNVTNQFKFKTYITNQISTETNFIKKWNIFKRNFKNSKTLKISQT